MKKLSVLKLQQREHSSCPLLGLWVSSFFVLSPWSYTPSVFALDLPAAFQKHLTHFHIFPSKSLLQSLAIPFSFSRLFL